MRNIHRPAKPGRQTEELDPDLPSKSARKAEVEVLQDLGERLIVLPAERLKRVPLPENLRDAIRDAQRFTKHEARRRQMQLIGKIMRSVDTAPLQAALDEVNGISAAANARQHRLEKLREQIMADEKIFADIGRDYPAADLQQLRQLRRNALKEAEQKKPPRAFRELFRQLRELTEANEPEAKVGAGETAVSDHTAI